MHDPDERSPDDGPLKDVPPADAGPVDEGQDQTVQTPDEDITPGARANPGFSPAVASHDTGHSVESDTVPDAADSLDTGQTDSRSDHTGSAVDDSDLPADQELTPELVEDEAIRGDFMIRWAVILLALLLGIREVNQTATLVRIRSGDAIRANNLWPLEKNEFSYTASERMWVNTGWLSDVVFSLVHDVAGPGGLSLLTGLLAAATFWILSLISRPGTPTWWGSVCATLALLTVHLQFSALPEMVTLLGTVWVLRNIISWSETGERKYIWCIVGSLVVWANLDSRAWLGATLVILWAVGTGVSRMLFSRSRDESDAVKSGAASQDLLLMAGGSLLALILNPFGWGALLAPGFYYTAELPAMRYYLADATEPLKLQILGLLDPGVWKLLNHHIISGFVILAAALVLSVMRGRRHDTGLVLAILAGIAGCLFCLLNLPVVALVAAVAATLAGQDWYRTNCRQEYSTGRLEVLLSRGGRAVTVLALASVAWLGIGGRLIGTGGAQIGIGFSPQMKMMIQGTAEDLAAAPAGEIFTLRPDHGDLLIWHGQRAFLDSRMGLYVASESQLFATAEDGPDTAENFMLLHDQARQALRVPAKQVNDADPRGTWEKKRQLWQETFDRFGITSVAPRMWGEYPDYNTWTSLLVSQDWTLLYQGGTSALFLRTDRTGVSLKSDRFNRIDLPGMAFKEPEDVLGQRLPATPVNFSEELLTAQLPMQSLQLQKARHFNYYLQVAVQGVPVTGVEALSLANLSIREANRALLENASNTTPYVELALGAAFAREVESGLVGPESAIDISHQRFIQYIHALNMALRFQPDDLELLSRIAVEYEQAGRLDLAMDMADRCLLAIVHLPPAVNDQEFSSRQQLSDSMRALGERHAEHRALVEKELAERLQDETADPLHIAATLRKDGFLLRAMQVIEEEPALVNNLESRLSLAFLYSESGRLEEAADLFNVINQMPDGPENPLPWRLHAAWTNMSLGDYEQAILLCRKRIADITKAGDRFQGSPTEVARLHWTLVRCCLESGQCARAGESLVELQKTPLNPLATLILKEIDPDAVLKAPVSGQTDTQPGDKADTAAASGAENTGDRNQINPDQPADGKPE